MNILKVVSGFLPFVAFSVLALPLGVGGAALAGFGVAIVVVAATARGGIKILPTLQAGILLVMAVAGFLTHDPARADLTKYGPAVAALIMGGYMIGTAARMPFTAQYARDSVPRQFWHDPRFLAVNRRTSSAWGVAVLLLGLLHLASAAIIDAHGGNVALRLAMNWVLPIAAMWWASAYTRRVVDAAKQMVAQAHAQAQQAQPQQARNGA